MPKNRISKLADGRRSYKATDRNGKRHTLRSRKGETLRDFQLRCDQLDLECDPERGATDLVFGDLFQQWIAVHETRVSPAQAKVMRDVHQLYVRDRFGAMKLSEITPADIYALLTDLAEQGFSRSYASKIVTSIRMPFSWAAQELGLRVTNPCAGVRIQMPKRSPVSRVIDAESERRFFAAASASRYEHYFRLLLATGLRPSEALGLQLGDIKSDGLHIIRGITAHGMSDLKTSRARRIFPKTEKVVEALDSQLELLDRERYTGSWLFPRDGHPDPSAPAADKALRRIVAATAVWKPKGQKRHGTLLVPPVEISRYDFRHTFATRAARVLRPSQLQYLMGHESIETTLSYYVHLGDEDVSEAIQALNRL
ncbi:MAG: tyrosine-type recombinase/integrase [Bacillota bacterium]|nr:tyrosine-type recombinase/integrase [Bacillota bacterium]